jgi:Rieske [2Fe-2S] domain
MKEISIATFNRVLIEVPQECKRLLVQIEANEVLVTSDRCRHRGGPIHLCHSGKDGVRRCPWHDRKILQDEYSEEVCATFHRQTGVLRLISSFSEDTPWPVRIVTDVVPTLMNADA